MNDVWIDIISYKYLKPEYDMKPENELKHEHGHDHEMTICHKRKMWL